jgi:hypothetical protein
MKTLAVALGQSLLAVAWLAAPPQAADDEALKKDLTAVIALHGLPCGQVIDVKGWPTATTPPRAGTATGIASTWTPRGGWSSSRRSSASVCSPVPAGPKRDGRP